MSSFSIDIVANVKKFVNAFEKVSDVAKNVKGQLESTGSATKKLGTIFSKLDKSAALDKLDEATSGLSTKFIEVGSTIQDAFEASGVSVKAFAKQSATAILGVVKSLKLARIGAVLFQGALIATGIGALVVAVGLLVANFDKIQESVSGVSTELRNQLKQIEKQQELGERRLAILNNSDNILKQQGKTQTQINNLKIKEINALILAGQLEVANLKESLKSIQKRQKAYAAVIKFIINTTTIAIKGIASFFDAIFSKFDVDLGLVDKVKEIEASLISFATPDLGFDEYEKDLKAAELQLVKFKNQLAGLELQNDALAGVATPLVKTISTLKALGLNNTFNPLAGLAERTKTEIQNTQAVVTEKGLALLLNFQELTANLASTVQQGIGSAIGNVGSALGEALATGGDVLGAVGNALIQSVGSILGSLGDLFIKYGIAAVAYSAAANALKTPATAAPAGLALIAAGAALKIFSGAIGATAGGGSGGGGGASSSSGGGDNVTRTTTSFSNDGGGRVIFEIAGSKLIGVLNNSLRGGERVGGAEAIGG